MSGRAEAVKKAGMKKSMSYHKAKAYKELQRDIEAMTLSANPAVAGSAGVASKAGGLGVLIYTNANHGTGTPNGSTTAHTSGAPTTAPVVAGTLRAFTEALLKAAIQATYTASGKVPPMVVMSPSHKATFSGFTGIAANRVNLPGKSGQGVVVGGADVYLSDFGKLEVVPHYLMAGSNVVFGLNPEYGDVVYLRGFSSTPLGVTGDNTAEQVLVDATVRLTSEMANFKIADLTA